MPVFYTDILSDDGHKYFLTSGPYDSLEDARTNEHRARNIAVKLAESEGNYEIGWYSFGTCGVKQAVKATPLMKVINKELGIKEAK
jgi:hypothetical protein